MPSREFESQRRDLAARLQSRYDLSPEVTEAIATVPREEFVPDRLRSSAYADKPLPIGDGQTISAPHMVAMMVAELALDPGADVLEIGTGCGYHAAVTAELVGPAHVYSVEYSESLAESARERLAELGYGDISIRHANGYHGWAEHAPYDAAYLTCAAGRFPDAVIDQVRVGGRLLGPLGRGAQRLVRAEKLPDGSLDRADLGGVRFVEMRGGP
ncbi:MAG: protein-L-isoaspartate(D-aspartate) O-methyltransferase [Halodesulfurarchaeum sp.]|nr:protein-L-isoaspartate(D-aspartate) O-methyltransferase [Halodesulfurarchaeum sp.]